MKRYGAKSVIVYNKWAGGHIDSDIPFTPFQYLIISLAPLTASIIPLVLLTFKVIPVFSIFTLYLIIGGCGGDLYGAIYCLRYFNQDVLFKDEGPKFTIYTRTELDHKVTM